jgi:hypothetical protein
MKALSYDGQYTRVPTGHRPVVLPLHLTVCSYHSAVKYRYSSEPNQGPSVSNFHFHLDISLCHSVITSQPDIPAPSVCS